MSQWLSREIFDIEATTTESQTWAPWEVLKVGGWDLENFHTLVFGHLAKTQHFWG